MVQSKISLTVLGVLGLSMLAAMVWQQSHAHFPHYQPLWHYGVSTPKAPLTPSWSHRHTESDSHHHSHHQHGAHEYSSPGKPAAGVTLVSRGLQSLPLLETSQVSLTLQTGAPGRVRITLETSPQLQLLGGASEQVLDLEGSDTLQLPLNLMAVSEGRHYVHMFIEHTDANGTTTARALATEFRVGLPLVEKSFDKHLSLADPNRQVSLPGRETIY